MGHARRAIRAAIRRGVAHEAEPPGVIVAVSRRRPARPAAGAQLAVIVVCVSGCCAQGIRLGQQRAGGGMVGPAGEVPARGQTRGPAVGPCWWLESSEIGLPDIRTSSLSLCAMNIEDSIVPKYGNLKAVDRVSILGFASTKRWLPPWVLRCVRPHQTWQATRWRCGTRKCLESVTR
jgi:hypothetical protein